MPTFFVTGATGTQGGATTSSLLSTGHEVHTLVRNSSSAAALALQSAGVKLFPGSFSDVSSIIAAANGCQGVFLNVTPDFIDPNGELQNAKNIIRASKEAGVKHIIYSSVLKTGQHSRFPDWDPNSFMANYWISKSAIEDEVRGAGFQFWTILRPGFFMTNLLPPVSQYMYPELWTESLFKTDYKQTTRIGFIDPADIGAVAAKVFDHGGGGWTGVEIDMYGEELTVKEAVNILGEVARRDIKCVQFGENEVPDPFRSKILESQRLVTKLDEAGTFLSDLALLKSTGVASGGFREFFKKKKLEGKL
jgi:uncharacterized protein YbjT (DUF2867 family)